MTEICGCCEGLEALTPLSTANRPGLEQLRYRIGTHAIFLETMKARLSSSDFPALEGLKTRDSSDPTIALLDAWALVADVLTFYQERIANEGYLRTATERRSVLELGRLVGYTLRPGVSASVYPAFMMEPGTNKGGEIPKGTRVQSIPGPGEMPQFFETSERIEARTEWNELKPRLTQPQKVTLSKDGKTIDQETLYFQGTSTNLKANDPLLLVSGSGQNAQKVVRHVKTIEPDNAANRTKVSLQEASTSPPIPAPEVGLNAISTPVRTADASSSKPPKHSDDCAFEKLDKLVEPLTRKPSLQPPNRQQLDRSPQQTFKCQSDMPSRLLSTLQPSLSNSLYQAWANLPVTNIAQVEVHAFRTKASPFGHNAPLRPDRYDEGRKLVAYEEWTINNPLNLVAPTAIVTPDTRSGSAPLTVNFTNRSTGNITSYAWDFGDNSTSSGVGPVIHNFQSAGTYTVTLTVTGPGGSNIAQTTITVAPPIILT